MYSPHRLIENCIPQFSTAVENCIPHWTLPHRCNQPGRFLFNKKFRLLQISEISGPPKGTVDYDPIQGTARLVIVLVRSIQKSGTRYNNLANGKEPSWTDQIGPYLKVVQNIPVGPNRNDPFHLISNRSFCNFGLNEWKAPKSRL